MSDEAFGSGTGTLTDSETGYTCLFNTDTGFAFGPIFVDGPDEAAGYLMFCLASGFDRPWECDAEELRELYEGFTKMVQGLDIEPAT